MPKVMLVEDDNNLREIYEARLQAEGYQTVSARDGEEALVVAKAEKPDLIISDVMMPKISGFEMLDIIRNTDGLKEVKVIMLTALGQTDDQQRADRLGADRYLVKSQVTLEDIVKVAHELLQDNGDAAAGPDGGTPAADAEAPAPSVTPTDTPAASPPPGPLPESADDDQLMNNAAQELADSANAAGGITTVAPDPEPTMPEAPAESAVEANSGDPTVAGKKVIEPPASDSKNIEVLLAEEAAKESGVSATLAEPAAQEVTDMDAKIEDFVAGATTDATPPTAESEPAATPEPAPEETSDSPGIGKAKSAVIGSAPDTPASTSPIPPAPPSSAATASPSAPQTNASGETLPPSLGDPNSIAL